MAACKSNLKYPIKIHVIRTSDAEGNASYKQNLIFKSIIASLRGSIFFLFCILYKSLDSLKSDDEIISVNLNMEFKEKKKAKCKDLIIIILSQR